MGLLDIFKNRKPAQITQDFGFTACQTCATEHVPSCSKIDGELMRMFPEYFPEGLDPDQARERLALVKQEAFAPKGPGG